MAWLRRLIRIPLLILHLLLGVLLATVLVGVLRMTYQTPRYQRTKQWWLKMLAYWTGADIAVKGEPLAHHVMWMANHVSWLDIGVLGGVGVPRFLSKSEVKKWPIIGWLATASGTLYIERGQSAEEAAEQIRQALNQGDRVALFPEGTTGDGLDVKRFFARLFAPALETKTPVQPVVLRYLDQAGHYQPQIPFVGDQNMIQNMWRVTGCPRFIAQIEFLPAIDPAGYNRKTLAQKCEDDIRASLKDSFKGVAPVPVEVSAQQVR